MSKPNCVSKYLSRSPRYQSRKPARRRSLNSSSTGKLVLSQKALTITLMCFLVLGGILHLSLINSRVGKTFESEAIMERIAQLQKTQKELEKSAAELQSIKNIQTRVDLSGYVPTTDISYLRESDYALLD